MDITFDTNVWERMVNEEELYCHQKFRPLSKPRLCTANGDKHRPPDAEIFDYGVIVIIKQLRIMYKKKGNLG